MPEEGKLTRMCTPPTPGSLLDCKTTTTGSLKPRSMSVGDAFGGKAKVHEST